MVTEYKRERERERRYNFFEKNATGWFYARPHNVRKKERSERDCRERKRKKEKHRRSVQKVTPHSLPPPPPPPQKKKKKRRRNKLKQERQALR